MIYTFGDGFAAGHIWPEWPQILQAVSHDIVINQAYPGAGNDLIFSTALRTAWSAEKISTFIIQWAPCRRFDKLLEDDSWNHIIKNDSKYANAVYQVYDQKWWLSSGSNQVLDYHNKYQQIQQKTLFDIYHMILLNQFLISQGHRCLYLWTYDFDSAGLDPCTKQQFNQLPWINGSQGMDTLIDRSLRGTDIQPLPLGHALWVQQYLIEFVDEPKLNKMIELLSDVCWVAFDPDRDEQWNQIKNQLS